jgi:hypothetical protein
VMSFARPCVDSPPLRFDLPLPPPWLVGSRGCSLRIFFPLVVSYATCLTRIESERGALSRLAEMGQGSEERGGRDRISDSVFCAREELGSGDGTTPGDVRKI